MSSVSLVLLAVCAMAIFGNCYGYPLQQIISSTTSEFETASNSVNSQQYTSNGLGSTLDSSSITQQSYDYENNYESQQSNLLTTPNSIMQTTQQQSDYYNSNSDSLIQTMQQNNDLYPSDELLAQQQQANNMLSQQQSELYTTTSDGLLQTENSQYSSTYNSFDNNQDQTIINNYEVLDESDSSDDSS